MGCSNCDNKEVKIVITNDKIKFILENSEVDIKGEISDKKEYTVTFPQNFNRINYTEYTIISTSNLHRQFNLIEKEIKYFQIERKLFDKISIQKLEEKNKYKVICH